MFIQWTNYIIFLDNNTNLNSVAFIDLIFHWFYNSLTHWPMTFLTFESCSSGWYTDEDGCIALTHSGICCKIILTDPLKLCLFLIITILCILNHTADHIR